MECFPHLSKKDIKIANRFMKRYTTSLTREEQTTTLPHTG
jgi:hypothetical protein